MTKPKIFVFPQTLWGGVNDSQACVALAEDGTPLAGHFSSSKEWAQHDMGVAGHPVLLDREKYPSTWKHDLYQKHYPDGYEVEWVDFYTVKNQNHEGVVAAFEKNKQLEREAGEVGS